MATLIIKDKKMSRENNFEIIFHVLLELCIRKVDYRKNTSHLKSKEDQLYAFENRRESSMTNKMRNVVDFLF